MSVWRLLLTVTISSHVILLCGSAPGVSEARIRDSDIDSMEADLEGELMEESRSGPIFLNEWAAEIPGGSEVADIIARDLGYTNMGQIGQLENHFLFEKLDHPSRTKRSAHEHTRSLRSDTRVVWAEQQRSITRVKRDFIMDKRQEERAYRDVRYTDEKWDKQWYLSKIRQKRSNKGKTFDKKMIDKSYTDLDKRFDDDMFQQEWYLIPESFDKRANIDNKRYDLCVVPTWSMGITGKGVNVTVIDDGLEIGHADIEANYNPDISYDYNDRDNDPTLRYDKQKTNKHGTRCAGEIAMVANNGICGVGVAYNCNIGSIRLLDGMVTDKLEAEALANEIRFTNIYSSSWGPSDQGGVMEGPGKLAQKSLELGITKGRGGLGVIYVWAAGNGGSNGDNCNCDGYTGSIYTLSITSVTHGRKSPWYAEYCASTMASTYSSGAYGEEKVVSTDINNECTNEHTGTSASAPLAAGIFALLLEASPNLTWRDVQHLVVWTSEYTALCAEEGWTKNGAGYYVSSKFGFGLLSACKLIMASDHSVFRTVPEKSICEVDSDKEGIVGLPVDLTSGNVVELSIETSGCKDQDNEVNYLEHIQLVVDMDYSKRGALEIFIVSPSGTNTTLLAQRKHDHSTSGIKDWPFMSVHTWGEKPEGTWKVYISDPGRGNHGTVNKVMLVLHGTKKQPWHVRKAGGSRTYDMENTECTQDDTTGQDDDADRIIPHRHNIHRPGNQFSPTSNLNQRYMTDDVIDAPNKLTNQQLSTSDHDDIQPPSFGKNQNQPQSNSADNSREKFQQSIDELRKYIPSFGLGELGSDEAGTGDIDDDKYDNTEENYEGDQVIQPMEDEYKAINIPDPVDQPLYENDGQYRETDYSSPEQLNTVHKAPTKYEYGPKAPTKYEYESYNSLFNDPYGSVESAILENLDLNKLPFEQYDSNDASQYASSFYNIPDRSGYPPKPEYQIKSEYPTKTNYLKKSYFPDGSRFYSAKSNDDSDAWSNGPNVEGETDQGHESIQPETDSQWDRFVKSQLNKQRRHNR